MDLFFIVFFFFFFFFFSFFIYLEASKNISDFTVHRNRERRMERMEEEDKDRLGIYLAEGRSK